MSVSGAKELQIEWGNDSSYWNWTSHAYSRFPEVAELKSVLWFDIIGNIKTRFLSPETTYAAFLVFKLVEGAQGLEVANAEVKFVEDERGKQVEREEVQPMVVHLQASTNEGNYWKGCGTQNGWMEVDIGNFIFQNGYEGEVNVRLRDTMPWMKTGPIIDGIEFRAVYTEFKFLPNTVLRNRRGRGGGNFSRFTSSQINESFAVDWEKYVMPDYQHRHRLIGQGFSLDGRNRKICYMLGARRLYIAGGDNPIKWEWRPHADSRFVGDDSDEDADKRARVVHLHTTENRHGDKAVTRDDGWVEVEMGNFYLDDAEQGEVEARLFEKTKSESGLIVEGIEFRPICIEISDTLSLDKKAVLPNIRIQG